MIFIFKSISMKNKSILEQALLQVQNLEEAVKTNAKGILSSTMKEELNELLKESITEEEEMEVEVSETEDEIVPEENEDVSEQDEEDDEDDSLDMDSEDEDDSVGDMEDVDSEDEVDDFEDDVDSVDDMDSDDELDSDFDMDSDLDSMDDDDDTLDLTGASDEEVLKVFKSMKPEDGVIVKKDDDDISLELDGDEYIIKDEQASDAGVEDDFSDLAESDDESDEDDDIFFGSDDKEDEEEYEIEIDEEEEVEEAARTKWNPHGDKGPSERAGLKSKKMFKAGAGNLNEEVSKLRKQNQEYKKALVLFKEKLNEVAVFNANLAYATRLFTENTTTKQEKLNILKRFDNVSTLTESKNLYKSIKTELETKKPITESVVEKINSTPKSSSSKEVLAESKAYENPQFKRMRELMGKVK